MDILTGLTDRMGWMFTDIMWGGILAYYHLNGLQIFTIGITGAGSFLLITMYLVSKGKKVVW